MIDCPGFAAIDGDTIVCAGIHMRLLGDGTPFVDGVDTPERGARARCEAERTLAETATRRLAELARTEGKAVELSGETDRFGRPLVRIRLADGRTAGGALIAEGLAVVWTPRHRHDWCAGEPATHVSQP